MNLDSFIAPVKNALVYGDRPEPYRDWFVLLGVCILLFIASFAFNVWLFLRIASGASLGGTPPAPASGAFNAVPLETVQTLFNDRAAEAKRYQGQYPFVDPSR